MQTAPHLNQILAKITDPCARLRLLREYGVQGNIDTETRDAALADPETFHGFSTNRKTQPGSQPNGFLFGTPASLRRPIRSWPRTEEEEKVGIERYIQPGDYGFVVRGASGAEDVDIAELLMFDTRTQAETFVRKVLGNTLARSDRRINGDLEPAPVVDASLAIARTLLENEDPLRQRVERWALRERLCRFEFVTIADDRREAGEDPFETVDFRDRLDRVILNRAILIYALETIMRLAPAEEAETPSGSSWQRYAPASIISDMLRPEHHGFIVEQLLVMRWLYDLPGIDKKDRTHIVTELRHRYQLPFLKALTDPETAPSFEGACRVIGPLGFWDGMAKVTFKHHLIERMANGDFQGVHGLLTALRDSSLDIRLPKMRSEGADEETFRAEWDALCASMRQLMPEVYARAFAKGRLDVAAFLLDRCLPNVLPPCEEDFKTDLRQVAKHAIPEDATVIETSHSMFSECFRTET